MMEGLLPNNFQIVANNLTLAANSSVSSENDDCYLFAYWGFSLYTSGQGTITIEYSADGSTWRTLETINVNAGNENRVYRVTRRYYRITYTDTSGADSTVDLITVKSPA